jgi:uncharacterized protein (TIGR02001 family)
MLRFSAGLKSRVGAVLLTGAALGFSIAPAFAADLSLKDTPVAAPGGDKFEWTGYVQGTSDYIFRGISQTRREPTVQGGLDGTYGMFYIGTFVSGVNFNDKLASFNLDSNVEVDIYGGIKPKWGDVTFDFGVIAYTYPGSNVAHPKTFDPTYIELKAGASTTVLKDVSLSGTIFYSPNYNGEVGAATTLEGTVSKPLFTAHNIEFATSGTLGHIFFDKSLTPTGGAQDDYSYWNVGLTATYKKNYSLDLRFWDTSLDTGIAPCGGNTSVFQCGPTFVATAKVAF